MTNELSMKNITKNFGSFQALNKVDFTVQKGEIHALLGANGAGKSTLMKILCGAYDEYEGKICKDGGEISISSPKEAKRQGIGIVHQEVDVALIPSLSVAENIVLDVQASNKSKAFVNWKSIYKKAEEALSLLGSSLSVKKNVIDLTLSEKQQVLIARAIVQNVDYLILDEPTAPLSVEETKQLFSVMRELKKSGVGIIYISHRLQEVVDICDRLTVLKDGRYVATKETSHTSIEDVITLMLGTSSVKQWVKKSVEFGNELLHVEALSLPGRLSNISFHVKEGEVVGIAGLVGAGKTELCRSLFGLEQYVSGSVRLKDKKLKLNKQPYYYIAQGLSLVPEERRKEGIFVHESIADNLVLPSLSRFTKYSFIKRGKIKEKAQKTTGQVGVKSHSIEQSVGTLSGGNQQKVAIGKWLVTDSDVLLFDEPTKGVDVGSKREIFDLITNLVSQKKGVVYATCEFEELLGVADRIYVMYNGKIVKELSKEEATSEKLFYYTAGGVKG
ncbi:sugar ABC transporter ATP-binding protein [Priestia megaterium]|uniref:sugar ABC transporter ATP-binding protein n=1 Tax=Priestia megaterium TaxID=1404 RepID=UPI003F7EB662